MRFAFSGLLALVLSCAAVLSANAATVRYTFDVVDVQLDIYEAYGLGGSPYSYADIVQAAHPLSYLLGETFSMTLHVELPGAATTDAQGIVSCISGPFCVSGTNGFDPFVDRSVYLEADGTFTTNGGSDYIIHVDFDPRSNAGTMTTEMDLLDQGFVDIGGFRHYWQAPKSSFTITNVSTSILPAPLPASSLLLGAALVPLALWRRKSRV